MARLFNNFLVADRPILEAADYAESQITMQQRVIRSISEKQKPNGNRVITIFLTARQLSVCPSFTYK